MRFPRPARITTVALAAAGVTALGALAAPAAMAAPATSPVSVTTPSTDGAVTSWQVPSASRPSAAAEVTGTVADGQRVGIVRLADVGGQPAVTVVQAVGQTAAEEAVRSAQSAPGTLAVSVDLPRKTFAVAPSNDTYRGLQWALDTLGAETVWRQTTGTGVTVAVVDTGVAAVPDLAGQVLSGTDLVTGNGNGTADGNGHGTHVAGIVAAKANNDLGVAGLAPGVKILPVRVLDANGSGYDSGVAQGIIYATEHGASVINLSLGGAGYSSVLAQAVSYAQSHNVVVVAAAGNERQSGNQPSYPAALPGVLAVAATDRNDAVASFSNTGGYVQVAAPGVDIASTVLNGYAYNSGTSMASPYAAATAALVRSANPQLSASAVVADVTRTATDLGPSGRDDASGAGLVDPLKAVCAVSSCAPAAAPAVTRFDLQRLPAGVLSGTVVTARAQLRRSSTGAALAGQRVQWCYALPNQAAHCETATTDASGWISKRFTLTRTGRISAGFGGAGSYRPSATVQTQVAVQPRITVRLAKATVAVTVAPAARQPVQLQRWTGRTWQVVRNVTTDAAGRVTWTQLASGATVRVAALAYAGRAAAVTSSYRIP